MKELVKVFIFKLITHKLKTKKEPLFIERLPLSSPDYIWIE